MGGPGDYWRNIFGERFRVFSWMCLRRWLIYNGLYVACMTCVDMHLASRGRERKGDKRRKGKGNEREVFFFLLP